MLKLTEAELAGLGFSGNSYIASWSGTADILYFFQGGEWNIEIALDSGFAAYPQTKEDLLTLMRMLTPPEETSNE